MDRLWGIGRLVCLLFCGGAILGGLMGAGWEELATLGRNKQTRLPYQEGSPDRYSFLLYSN